MGIVRIGAYGKSHIMPAAFENAQEIESVIAENPQLLVADGVTPPVLVSQQLRLGDCRLDLLLLDAQSIPIVVESTLATSDACRREVVADVIDSISTLAQLTAAQLNDAAGGAVERALRTFAVDESDDFGQRWTSLAMNLQAARVTFIVAVDELSPSLDRQIRFLAQHSDLDVQCVAITKSREPSGDTYYAPSTVLGSGGPRPQSAWSKLTPPESQAALESVERAPALRAIRLVGSAANYHETAAPRRASALYELMRREGTLPVDLDRVQWDG